MLHNLELAMGYGCPSGIDVPGFLWYAPCHSRYSDSRAAHCCGLWLFSLFFSVLSVVTLVEYALPGTSLLTGEPLYLVVPWVTLSVSLNVVVTSMICFRLLRMRALMRDVLSPEMSRMYTSIAAMLIESAAPFSILGIGLVVTAALRTLLVPAFGYVWTMFCVESQSSPCSSVRDKSNCCSPFLSVSLAANDHPPCSHGQRVAQRDYERAQHRPRVRGNSHRRRAKSGGVRYDSPCR